LFINYISGTSGRLVWIVGGETLRLRISSSIQMRKAAHQNADNIYMLPLVNCLILRVELKHYLKETALFQDKHCCSISISLVSFISNHAMFLKSSIFWDVTQCSPLSQPTFRKIMPAFTFRVEEKAKQESGRR
jgi:hypothetical protein